MKLINKKILRMLPAIIYFGFIWYLSSKELAINISGSDKIIHALEYSLMGFLLAFGFDLKTNNFYTAGFCFGIAVLTGAVDEIHQYYVPGRSSEFADFIADMTGCAIGIMVWLIFTKFLLKIRHKH